MPRPLLIALALACCLLLAPATAPAGTIVADNGFRPEPNGFSFPNYGDEEGYANLDASELERLYGPGVCLAGGKGRCVLTPVARTYLQAFNEGAADGHCFGFATLAELIYKGYLPRFGYSALAAFDPGASATFGLGIERSRLLQRSIARAFNFQNLPAIAEQTLIGTPREILQALLHGALDPENKEIWTFEIFQYGMKAGHAITPYAVEAIGNGVYEVLVYDNNWPGDGERRLEIDAKANTWSYYAMISPGYPQAQYEGNAKSMTLRLAPVTPGLGVQPCPFCVGRQGGGSKWNELRLDGSGSEHAKFLITDAKGRQTGYKGGRFVNQIPGAKVVARTSTGYRKSAGGQLFADSPAPVVRLPRGVDFEVEIDGRHLNRRDRETLSLVGPTYDATVENLIMGPRQTAHVALSPHGNAITYRPSPQTVSPAISLGAETKSPFQNAACAAGERRTKRGKDAGRPNSSAIWPTEDAAPRSVRRRQTCAGHSERGSKQIGYDVTVAAVGAPKGTSLTFVKVPEQKLMWFGDDTPKQRVYKLTIDRIGNDGLDPETFARTLAISGGQQAFLYYGPLAKRRGIAKIVVYSPGRERHPIKVIPIEREG